MCRDSANELCVVEGKKSLATLVGMPAETVVMEIKASQLSGGTFPPPPPPPPPTHTHTNMHTHIHTGTHAHAQTRT